METETKLSNFLNFLRSAKSDYTYSYNRVNELDKLTQDYLHDLELNNLTYKERAKVATSLARCRKERRVMKDTVRTLEPLVTLLDSKDGERFLKLLSEALGKTRKITLDLNNRRYTRKVDIDVN